MKKTNKPVKYHIGAPFSMTVCTLLADKVEMEGRTIKTSYIPLQLGNGIFQAPPNYKK